MRLPPNLKQLQHAVLLDDERHFARAAQRANLSTSAFSRSIAALEQTLSLMLFERGPGPVRPTPAGERALALARRLLTSSADLGDELDYLRSGALGRVRAGAGPSSGPLLLTPALLRLCEQHPGIEADIEINHLPLLLQQLKEARLDFVLGDVRFLPDGHDWIVEPLGSKLGSLFCRAGHPLARRRSLSRADLAGQVFACVQIPALFKRHVGAALAGEAQGQIPLVLECGSTDMLREFVLGSDAILLALHVSVARELASGQMRELKVKELVALGGRSPANNQIGLVTLRGRTPLRASEHLMALVREEAVKTLLPPATPARN